MKTGLVLEGGGMRGVYTTGVLDGFLDHGITFDYIIGVSAGACHAASYLSGQRGRSFKISAVYSQDKRYVSVRNFLRTGSMFGMDFIFHQIPDVLEPFDYTAMEQNPAEFVVGVTELETGKPYYFSKPAIQKVNDIIAASSAIPVFSPPVTLDGCTYLDGGTSDPIPFRKALEDGCDRLVVVLTRPAGYRKTPEGFRSVYRRKFKKHPGMIETLDRRHEIYNEALDELAQLQKGGRAIVFTQSETVPIGRFEKEASKLTRLYETGLRDVETLLPSLRNW